MEHLWTWGGKYFGYRENDLLWTHDGRNVGRFEDEEVFGPDGRYLGELHSGKLITHIGKRNHTGSSFTPYMQRVGLVPYVDHVGTVMISGYEDFPAPERI